MKASPGARSWIAAGVRHELLMRALPALRHDMVAPVSVIRMGLLLLKRQAAGAPEAGTSVEERVGLVEEQLKSVVDEVRALREWELSASDEVIPRSELVTRCSGLLRAALEIHGIGLHIGDGFGPETDGAPLADGAALRYLFLGAICYLNDCVPHLGAIRIDAEGDSGLRFTASCGEAKSADPMTEALRSPRNLAIDAVALHALADDLGRGVVIEPDSVGLTLRS